MNHAWLFPGQGAQKVGMGSELVSRSPKAQEVFQRADEALGFSISRLCFEGPESELALTKYTQPAIVTASVAALYALREFFDGLPQPRFVAGHSLGEYSALVAADALSIEDAVRLVHIRGTAMQEAVPAGEGGMAAIMGGDAAAVQTLCDDAAQGECLSPANFNAPGQIVIAGSKAAVERAVALSKDRSLKAIVLNVSAPFHCQLMKPAAERVAQALSEIEVKAPVIPVIHNVTAQPSQSAEVVREMLIRQVDSAVLWQTSVEFMTAQGITRALELGPGKVLSGLVKRIDKSLAVHAVGSPDDLLHVESFLA